MGNKKKFLIKKLAAFSKKSRASRLNNALGFIIESGDLCNVACKLVRAPTLIAGLRRYQPGNAEKLPNQPGLQWKARTQEDLQRKAGIISHNAKISPLQKIIFILKKVHFPNENSPFSITRLPNPYPREFSPMKKPLPRRETAFHDGEMIFMRLRGRISRFSR
jgi:hypothetical protein